MRSTSALLLATAALLVGTATPAVFADNVHEGESGSDVSNQTEGVKGQEEQPHSSDLSRTKFIQDASWRPPYAVLVVQNADGQDVENSGVEESGDEQQQSHVATSESEQSQGGLDGSTPAHRHKKTVVIYGICSHPDYVSNFKRGGPGGEIMVCRAMRRALHSKGWSVIEAANVEVLDKTFRPYSSSYRGYEGKARDDMLAKARGLAPILVVDEWNYDSVRQWFGGGDDGKGGWKPQLYEQIETFVMAFFGIPTKDSKQGIPPSKVLTAFPTPWNTWLGFDINTTAISSCIERKQQNMANAPLTAILWGKEPWYFVDRRPLLEHLLGMGVKLYMVVNPQKDWSQFGGFEMHIPPGVQNLGTLPMEEWRNLLCSAHFIIGLGDPLYGPSPLETISYGGFYFNPSFDTIGTKIIHGNDELSASSQHPYLASLGSPVVCDYDPIVPESVGRCVERVRRFWSGAAAEIEEGSGQRFPSDEEGRIAMFAKVVDPFGTTEHTKRVMSIFG
ncbi:hypothetical protein HK102_000912, partial [Quaeritorhiza haematococci]